MKKIKNALISLSDKTDIEKILNVLNQYSVNIISTGGTYKHIVDLGFQCEEISNYTGFPEMLDGRVKTLHPKIHGGLLADLDKNHHTKSITDHNIQPIDLVIVNLYPFEKKLLENSGFEEMIENIDIGGPSMLRSAAKNFKHVTILPSPRFYQKFIEEMNQNKGATTIEFRKKMAYETFSETAFYDSLISNWMADLHEDRFPHKKIISGKLKEKLRYGENPHQQSAIYEVVTNKPGFKFKQLQGKELSHNNYLDAFNAYSLVNDIDKKSKTCAIIKHNNPCGCSEDQDETKSYLKALKSDPISAFGGIVAVNYSINEKLASEMVKTFYEVILAPKIDDKAKQIFSSKKNLRVLEYDFITNNDSSITVMNNSFLLQDSNCSVTKKEDLKTVTKKQPTEDEINNLIFANQVCKHVKSNAIVIANHQMTLGIGAGQTSRVGSCELATKHASKYFSKEILTSVAASDAFFPFPDGLEILIKAGIKSVIQPGGSVKDQEVIDAANKANISMVFTNLRNFKH